MSAARDRIAIAAVAASIFPGWALAGALALLAARAARAFRGTADIGECRTARGEPACADCRGGCGEASAVPTAAPARIDADDPFGFPLDPPCVFGLTGETPSHPRIRLDPAGLPRVAYGTAVLPNPAYIAIQGWIALARARAPGLESALAAGFDRTARAARDWLLRNAARVPAASRTSPAHTAGAHPSEAGPGLPTWHYEFPYAEGISRLAPPWRSALAQGAAVSFLCRYGVLRNDRSALRTARDAARLFDVPVADGGLAWYGPDGLPRYEEYPCEPRPAVLDGWLFAVLSQHDLHTLAGDPDAATRFRLSVRAVEADIASYDSATGLSRYGRHGHYAPPDYHALNAALLARLAHVAGSDRLAGVAARWSAGGADRDPQGRGAQRGLARLAHSVVRDVALASHLASRVIRAR